MSRARHDDESRSARPVRAVWSVRDSRNPGTIGWMSTQTVELFYAILALLAVGAVATLVVIRLLAIQSEAARGWYGAIAQFVGPNAIGMAFWVALLATMGSLYFSEIAHFEPCKLCWFQRIAMYPLVVLLGIAAVRRDDGIRIYGRAISAIGAAIALFVGPNAIGMAFWVALLATMGSLYFSEIAHFEPCKLCWFQRIAMYPLVVLLGIAAVRRDDGIRVYGRALSAIGALVALYHIGLEWIPALDTGACGTGPACSIIWFRVLGFISLPTLSLVAFLFIFTLLSVRDPDAGSEADGTDAGTTAASHDRSPA